MSRLVLAVVVLLGGCDESDGPTCGRPQGTCCPQDPPCPTGYSCNPNAVCIVLPAADAGTGDAP